eukprot:gene6744-12307_t
MERGRTGRVFGIFYMTEAYLVSERDFGKIDKTCQTIVSEAAAEIR